MLTRALALFACLLAWAAGAPAADEPGKYTVKANFCGSGQQLVTGPATLQLQLTTGFGAQTLRPARPRTN